MHIADAYYNNVDLNILAKVLQMLGISNEVIDCILNLYMKRKFFVKRQNVLMGPRL